MKRLASVFFLGLLAFQSHADPRPCTGATSRRVDDYRLARVNQEVRDHLKLVEDYHYGDEIRSISDPLAMSGNLDYIFNRFPNHHQALATLSRFVSGYDQPRALPQPARCYFERAINYFPDDPTPYLIYGVHSHRKGELDKALSLYQQAEKLYDRSAELHYNMGLLYTDKKDYAKAKQHAKRAYKLGYQLPGLKNLLIGAGHWP